MAHDYSYWRKARRTNTAPWAFFSARMGGAGVPGDLPAVQTAMPQRAPTALRTASFRFFSAKGGGENIAVQTPVASVSLPLFARSRARAANASYWRINKDFEAIVVAEVPPNPVFISDTLRHAPRTANTAYWQALRFQIGDEVPQNGRIFSLGPPIRRTAYSAYFVNPSFVVPDVTTVPPIVPAITNFARGSLRSANTSYWHNPRVDIADVIEAPPISQFISDIYRPLSRAARSAYWRNSELVVPDVAADAPPIMPFISDIPRRHRYLTNTAPWRIIGGKGGGADSPPVPTIAPTLFDFQRQRLRSARENYQIYPARQPALLFQPEGKILFPDHNNTWRRREAANVAYWRPNTGQIVYVDFPVELTAKPIPVRYWKPLRSAQSAYWKDNFGPIPVITFPEELSVKVIPNRAPGARRGANTLYLINGRITEVTTAFNPEIGATLFPVRVRGPQRAAQFAYWMPPPFLVQFPASLEPLIIGKARTMTLWAKDRDFLIPAKRRQFPFRPKRP